MNLMTDAELQAQAAALNLPPLPIVGGVPLTQGADAGAEAVIEIETQTEFEQRALPLIERGVPVVPLRPKTKVAFITEWQDIATTDVAKVKEWAAKYPDANVASVAKAVPGGVWFFDADREGLVQQIETTSGHKIPDTFMVRSQKGKGHYYFRQNAASIAMGNRQASDTQGELWSARVSDRYVVGPKSLHPDTGEPYQIIKDVPIVEAPQWLIDWCIAQTKEPTKKTGHAELDSEEPIAQGSRNNALTSILGKARQVLKMDKEQLTAYGLSVNQKRCVPPLGESEVRTIANSIGGYAVKESGTLLIGGVPVGQTQPAVVEQIELPKLNKVPYPVFPEWVMKGTSIYEGFVKPVCAVNSRIPYFMFLPAAALMMNYLGTKVRVEQRSQIPSFFMVLIGEKGRAIKSSSVEDAIEYLHVAGVMNHAGTDTQNAEGKSLVWTVGSPEGLGLEMARTNCKNAVLFYDELSTLTSKTEIDSSSLKSSLLTLYESGKFSNTIKSRKEAYSILPRTYCASLIACTTDDNFEDQWSRLSGKSTGLDDRFIFVLQPEKLDDLKLKLDVNTVLGSAETQKRIGKAVLQKLYSFDDTTPLEEKIAVLGNRTEVRAEKWALYFAIDLGRDTIDEDCVDRGIAVAQYEKAVKKYLGSPEAETRIAAAQIKYRRILERKFDGRATTRQMERAMNSSRYGTEGWYRIYDGLKKAGIIAEIGGGNPGVSGMLKEVIVREPLDE